MTTSSRKRPTPVKAPGVRAEAGSEIVPIAEWPAYKVRHGLRIVSGSFKPNDKYVHIVVEVEKPDSDAERTNA